MSLLDDFQDLLDFSKMSANSVQRTDVLGGTDELHPHLLKCWIPVKCILLPF